MRQVDTLWVFDVDGVLTHPSEKKVTQLALFDEIIKRLTQGEPVALNTGRSMDYIENQIINLLVERVEDTNILDSFLGVAEKGVIWETFASGNRQTNIDPEYSVPKDIQDAIGILVERSFSDVTFYDETKQTMVSVEMHDDFDVEKFWERQKDLDNMMQDVLDVHPSGEQYIVDPSRIATDIQAKGTGKHLGAKKILQWVREKDLVPSNVVCFGDGISDLAMAEEFTAQGFDTTFVYVGKKGALDEHVDGSFTLIYTDGHCEEGTLEYLQAH